jgi:hypothetical protein
VASELEIMHRAIAAPTSDGKFRSRVAVTLRIPLIEIPFSLSVTVVGGSITA